MLRVTKFANSISSCTKTETDFAESRFNDSKQAQRPHAIKLHCLVSIKQNCWVCCWAQKYDFEVALCGGQLQGDREVEIIHRYIIIQTVPRTRRTANIVITRSAQQLAADVDRVFHPFQPIQVPSFHCILILT